MSLTAIGCLRFDARQPVLSSLCDEIIMDLSQTHRTIPLKFFYDEMGSKLFEAICGTSEYYPTRTEVAILKKTS